MAIIIRVPGSNTFRLFCDKDLLLSLGSEPEDKARFSFLVRYPAKKSAIGRIDNRVINRIFLAFSFSPKFSMKYSVISSMIHPPLINMTSV
jgi:hypothetical protein